MDFSLKIFDLKAAANIKRLPHSQQSLKVKMTVKKRSGGKYVPVLERRGFIAGTEQSDKRAGALEAHHVHDLVDRVFGFG